MTRITLANQTNKYGAKRTEYNGRVFHSKREAQYAMELDLRVRAGDIHGYECQVPFKMEVRGKHICTYVMDFVILHNNGTRELIEVKGHMTDTYKIKAKLLDALYLQLDPDLKYTVVK